MKIKITILLLALLPIISSAESLSDSIPQGLLFQGKPIDPLCIYEAEEHGKKTDLKNCGVNSQPNRFIRDYDHDLINKGYIGFDFIWDAESSSGGVHGSSYYKVIGEINHAYLLYGLNYGGGSGMFSSLYIVKRINDTIDVTTLASGDRCNGGISEVSLKGSVVSYKADITAYDFLALAKNNPHKLNPYEDLDACAACCIATATFELNLQGTAAPAKLINIDLDAYPPDSDKSPSSATYQFCFDKTIKEVKQNGKHVLTPQELYNVTQIFNTTCVNSSEKLGNPEKTE